MPNIRNEVLLFGEVLWDRLPQGDFLGGAPLNVAWNLHALGVPAYIMSSLGEDPAGNRARQRLQGAGLPLDLLQTTVEDLPTGYAEVSLSPEGVPNFRLPQPVAFDDILPGPEPAALLDRAAFLYYGTLAMRAETSRRTLFWLWDMNPGIARFCDLNLRAPHYDRRTVLYALQHADVLKLNEEELRELTVLGLVPGNAATLTDLPGAIRSLGLAYDLQSVYLTRGGEPLLAWDRHLCPEPAEYPVLPPVNPAPDADTVGAGDAFCAGLLAGMLRQQAWEDRIALGLQNAALVCGIAGAHR